jgi:ElaB/YqjD/DUF883 family membrane-anchored ribosome-binding protein
MRAIQTTMRGRLPGSNNPRDVGAHPKNDNGGDRTSEMPTAVEVIVIDDEPEVIDLLDDTGQPTEEGPREPTETGPEVGTAAERDEDQRLDQLREEIRVLEEDAERLVREAEALKAEEEEAERKAQLERALKFRLQRQKRERKSFKIREYSRGAREDAQIIDGEVSTRWATPPSIPNTHNPHDEQIDSWIRTRMIKFLKMEYAALRRAYFRFYKETESEAGREFKKSDRTRWIWVAERFRHEVFPQEWCQRRMNEEGLKAIVLDHSLPGSDKEEKEIREFADHCRGTKDVIHVLWSNHRKPLLAFAWKHTLVGDLPPMSRWYEENRKKGVYGKWASGNEYLPENEPISRKKCRSTTHHL